MKTSRVPSSRMRDGIAAGAIAEPALHASFVVADRGDTPPAMAERKMTAFLAGQIGGTKRA